MVDGEDHSWNNRIFSVTDVTKSRVIRELLLTKHGRDISITTPAVLKYLAEEYQFPADRRELREKAPSKMVGDLVEQGAELLKMAYELNIRLEAFAAERDDLQKELSEALEREREKEQKKKIELLRAQLTAKGTEVEEQWRPHVQSLRERCVQAERYIARLEGEVRAKRNNVEHYRILYKSSRATTEGLHESLRIKENDMFADRTEIAKLKQEVAEAKGAASMTLAV